jgi:hypothetical protein
MQSLMDTGQRQIIQWISKGWTEHELTLPVFNRESLARILCLERFRNLIETNIEAGITLYTDHKPALFENGLSSKGQLSAWKLAEVADLLSIVENLYRQGGKMLFADPLSRVCGPTEGWCDPSLPRKLAALFEHLPDEVRNNPNLRVYAGKDTYAAGRLVQKLRKPSDRISQGKLLTKDVAPKTFHIGVDDVNKCVKEVRQLLEEDKSFAILMPVSITSEIARLENKDRQRCHDESLAIKVKSMSKITLASSSEVWLVNLPGDPFNHFLSNDMEGLGLTGCKAVFQESLVREMDATAQMGNHDAEAHQEVPETRSRDRDEMFQAVPETRSRDRDEMFQAVPETRSRERDETLDAFPMTRSRVRADTTITTPAANSIISGDRTTTEHDTRSISPELENQKIKWKNVPRQPIPELQDVGL